MKFTKLLFAVALPALFFGACKDTQSAQSATEQTATNEVAAKPETASFSIEGMSCAMGCARTIEKKLAKLEGVNTAKVDYETKTAKVDFDAARLSPEKIVETVESAADGQTYKVLDLKSSGDHAMVVFDQEKKKDDTNSSGKKDKKSCSNSKDKKGCCAKKA